MVDSAVAAAEVEDQVVVVQEAPDLEHCLEEVVHCQWPEDEVLGVEHHLILNYVNHRVKFDDCQTKLIISV